MYSLLEYYDCKRTLKKLYFFRKVCNSLRNTVYKSVGMRKKSLLKGSQKWEK